jgi:hypothetical protein
VQLRAQLVQLVQGGNQQGQEQIRAQRRVQARKSELPAQQALERTSEPPVGSVELQAAQVRRLVLQVLREPAHRKSLAVGREANLALLLRRRKYYQLMVLLLCHRKGSADRLPELPAESDPP